MINALGFLSRHGRFVLVAGLVAGLALPDLAVALKPWLPQLVMGLLFIVALRIGPDRARAGLSKARVTFGLVAFFQLALPIGAILISMALGLAQSPFVMALVLVLAAPALSGSPSLAIIVDADPEPAFRMLIVGMVCLPVTMIPVFWLLPQFGDLGVAVTTAVRTLLAIVVSMGAGFLVCIFIMPKPTEAQAQALNGMLTIAMAVIVVGLMAALGPALSASMGTVAVWLALAFAINLGMQVVTFAILRQNTDRDTAVPLAIVAGNRNIAIFLVALSPEAAEPLLIFLGCYQFPMYLTPLLMQRIYGRPLG